jgi:hypothetical protein
MNAELALPELRPGDLHHARAVVELHHLRLAANQFSGIKARAARGVKDPLSRDISRQCQAGRPVVIGVEEPALGGVEKLICETSYWGLTPHLAVHAVNPSHRRWSATVSAITYHRLDSRSPCRAWCGRYAALPMHPLKRLATGGVAFTAAWQLILYGAGSRSQSGSRGWHRR